MRFELMFPSKYLAGADILTLPRKEVTVTIEKIYRDELKGRGGETEKAWLVKMHKAEKLWVLKKVHALVIADLYGPEADNWIGKRVILYTQKVNAFGKWWDAIRVKPEMPSDGGTKKSKPKAPPTDAGDAHEPPEDYDPSTGEVSTGTEG